VDDALRYAQNAGMCPTLLQLVRSFRGSLEHLVFDLATFADEWTKERVFDSHVVRHHRFRFVERLHRSFLATEEFRENDELPAQSLRRRVFRIADEIHERVAGILPRLDADVSPIDNWPERLQNAADLANDGALQLREILKDVETLEKLKFESINRVGDDVQVVVEQF
jgi:hypothetical protein